MARPSRRIIVQIATSADGYIARPDGGVEWLDRPDPPDGYGMSAFFDSIDTILWGRKTWDVGLELGGDVAGTYGSTTKHYIFSRQPRTSDSPSITWVNEPVVPFVRRFRAVEGKHIWMMGGAELIGAFLDEGCLDEFVIHVIPVFIGEGIPLVAPRHRSIELSLRSSQQYENGVVRLHYDLASQRG